MYVCMYGGVASVVAFREPTISAFVRRATFRVRATFREPLFASHFSRPTILFPAVGVCMVYFAGHFSRATIIQLNVVVVAWTRRSSLFSGHVWSAVGRCMVYGGVWCMSHQWWWYVLLRPSVRATFRERASHFSRATFRGDLFVDVCMCVAPYFNMTFGGIASVRFFWWSILGCVDVCRSIFQYDF